MTGKWALDGKACTLPGAARRKQRLCQEDLRQENWRGAPYNTSSVSTLFSPATCGGTVLGWAYLEVLFSGYSC